MANLEKKFDGLLKLYTKRDSLNTQIVNAERQLVSEAIKPPKAVKKPVVKKRATGKKAIPPKKR